MRWLSVAPATLRFETLKDSELPCGSRRGCYNNDWTGDTNDTSGVRHARVASRVRILSGLMTRSRFGSRVALVSIFLFRCALGTSVNRRRKLH